MKKNKNTYDIHRRYFMNLDFVIKFRALDLFSYKASNYT